jgi:transposase-like protein
MTTTRKQYSPKFKARVAVEAIRGEKTLSQLGSQFKVHPMQIAKWRKAALEQLSELFVGVPCGVRPCRRLARNWAPTKLRRWPATPRLI